MFCKDQSIIFLKSFGYNVVRLPKADIQPLQILTSDKGNLKNLGQLSTLMVNGSQAPLPTIQHDVVTANISGQRTSDLSAGVGLNILAAIIGAMGGSNLTLEAKYSEARTITFEYANVLSDTVEVASLDQFLADADVNPLSQGVAQLLEADDIYVITSVIKSKTFSISAKRKDNSNVTVSVPEIRGIVGGNVAVSGDSDMATQVTFEGQVPLVFGFQAIRLIYDNGKYTAFKPLDPQGGALEFQPIALQPLESLPQDTQDSREFLLFEGGLVNL